MNPKQIIRAGDYQRRAIFKKDGKNFLNVSEFYYDTIQGEGINIGQPAAFLRLKNCTMNCSYCDTTEVWRYGSPYSFTELLDLMSDKNIIDQLRNGQHLVITGGSPLLQQEGIVGFLKKFYEVYQFFTYVEIENECTLMPNPWMRDCIDCWNNSPKLASSGMSLEVRYKPELIKMMSYLKNSWFKFVISNEHEWDEIDEFYLKPGLVKREQIILMPEGATREDLQRKRLMVVDMAICHGVRYSTREHIILWDKKVGF